MSNDAKVALDKIIKKARIHFYKPIQIAEILRRDRLGNIKTLDITNSNSYRNASKQWRDAVTIKLVGRVSTSSQKYQDNLFDDNAVPPVLLAKLAQANRDGKGVVENYIYHRFKGRLQDVLDAYAYVNDATPETFSLIKFLDFFEEKAGLKRSVDKAFEIVVYALFSTLVDALQAQISLTLNNPDPSVLSDFGEFVDRVLGIKKGDISISTPAKMYRGGVTNAADRGLDIVTNYGPAIQVKHLGLDIALAENIVENVSMDDIVIVCKTAEAKIIQSVLSQLGVHIRGIITQQDLEDWYILCQTKYADTMGTSVVSHLRLEFAQEFPMLEHLQSFLMTRAYDPEKLHGVYAL